MAFGTSVAKAHSKSHDARRKLYLGKDATLTLVKGNRGETKLGDLTTGWHLDLRQRIEPVTGARYYRLYIDDVQGDRLRALKEMTAVRYRGVFYKPLAKPTFEGTVPSYVFRVEEVGPQI
jgi:hypothetical protein